jgi:hypothetical protein
MWVSVLTNTTLDSRLTAYEDVPGRFCGPPGSATANCCLPCPISPWIFDDSTCCSTANSVDQAKVLEAFLNTQKRLQYISPISLAACLFLLLSWLILPIDKSHRHYLSVGLVACILLVNVRIFWNEGGEQQLTATETGGSGNPNS